MNLGATLANTTWFGSSLPEYVRFRRSLDRVEGTQRAVLDVLLRRNRDTVFGKAHDFARLQDWEQFSSRVPPRRYDELQPWIDAIRQGEQRVLTADTVSLFEPTSGSSGAEKLVPYTASLQREIRSAVAAWVTRLFIEQPALLGGRAYWSLTPQLPAEDRVDSVVPIGFDDDGAYLGGLARHLLGLAMAARPGLKRLHVMPDFWFWSLVLLLGCRDLRLVSVWHPSYLLLLLEHLHTRWDELVDAIGNGIRRDDVGLRFDAAPARARELARLGPDEPQRIWRQLRLISCWGDAQAAPGVAEIRRRFPGVAVQEKGLIATEGIVTIPFGAHRPLAIRSHFFEFVDEDDHVHPAWRLQEGQSYTVLLTTGGGLYRYELRDRVEVTGRLGETPCLRFLGKADSVSDLYGEKLSEVFVAGVLGDLWAVTGTRPRFAMLAPYRSSGRARYELYVHADAPTDQQWETRLERSLGNNPHYRLCRELGQLDAVAVVPVAADAHARFIERLGLQGRRLGDIKPVALSSQEGWRATFGVD